MKITPSKVRKFQEGGAVDDTQDQNMTAQDQAQGAPQEQQGGQDPIAVMAQAAAQALQNQDCQLALQVCQAFIQLVQQMGQQQQGAEQPVYARKGAKIYRKR